MLRALETVGRVVYFPGTLSCRVLITLGNFEAPTEESREF